MGVSVGVPVSRAARRAQPADAAARGRVARGQAVPASASAQGGAVGAEAAAGRPRPARWASVVPRRGQARGPAPGSAPGSAQGSAAGWPAAEAWARGEPVAPGSARAGPGWGPIRPAAPAPRAAGWPASAAAQAASAGRVRPRPRGARAGRPRRQCRRQAAAIPPEDAANATPAAARPRGSQDAQEGMRQSTPPAPAASARRRAGAAPAPARDAAAAAADRDAARRVAARSGGASGAGVGRDAGSRARAIRHKALPGATRASRR